MKTNHDMADDVAEWAIKNISQLRTAEIDTRPSKLVKNGCTYQGRFEGQPEPAECCTEINADGAPSVWESADREVLPAFIGAFIAFVAFCALIWFFEP